jgi:hypothetical protein
MWIIIHGIFVVGVDTIFVKANQVGHFKVEIISCRYLFKPQYTTEKFSTTKE